LDAHGNFLKIIRNRIRRQMLNETWAVQNTLSALVLKLAVYVCINSNFRTVRNKSEEKRQNSENMRIA
jgi:hypothetical protein